MEISHLKQIAKAVDAKISPLIGTEEGRQEFEKGAGGDISMMIDLLAEKIVMGILEDQKSNVLLISEEIGEKYFGNKEVINKISSKLIVDPVDGSTNASRGIPFSCISLAYAEGNSLNSISQAVILDFKSKDIYWAEKGKGAFHNDKRILVSKNTWDDELLFEVDFNTSDLTKELSKYRRIIERISKTRVMGSCALSLCLLASGCIDCYFDFRKDVRLVDFAAGYLIIKEAGGELFTHTGNDLNTELSIDIRVPLIASNAKIAPMLRSELERINKR